ncbi:hypothetical protein RM555_29245 [Micromonospora sp. DSM 115977]|uniref:Prevent-host-death family protein n=1 Tax=Micromonospora reichwaldensis TaxID=3075516 RepID=A0ABU2X4G5_9ACTN|nr:hypothetical protein [Micromonospora sp. DSM 115977]MDT0533084.1 hypothetical protein [Micromonospora sp. DSM 115977]
MAEHAHREMTQRELRNDSGESFVITRNGTPVGKLIPLRRRTFVPRAEVLAAFATAPVLDDERFRADRTTPTTAPSGPGGPASSRMLRLCSSRCPSTPRPRGPSAWSPVRSWPRAAPPAAGWRT